MPALHAFASCCGWFAGRLAPYRKHVVVDNLAHAFPDRPPEERERIARAYYAGFADVMFEIAKGASLAPAELRARVRVDGAEPVRECIARGRPALLIAAHQCNWEWLLLALGLELGCPVDAAYKPLKNAWADREMRAVRARFGAHLVPAQELLPEILKRRHIPRAIAMVADQEPTHSERKHWTRFLGRDSAFFLGAEEIARTTRYPVYFLAMRRIARGRYVVTVEPFADPSERLAPGEFTDRYAARVEEQIRSSPPDWPWSHKRWRLRKPFYG